MIDALLVAVVVGAVIFTLTVLAMPITRGRVADRAEIEHRVYDADRRMHEVVGTALRQMLAEARRYRQF